MNKNNIFTKIINHEYKTKIVYQDKDITVFNDINPKAPVHIILVPNTYIKSMNRISNKHILILGKLLYVASRIAKKKNIHKDGYRIIINCNKYGGQKIDYLHIHLLGGCNLGNLVSI